MYKYYYILIYTTKETMGKFKQGIFRPENPEKYKGDSKNIVYRSSWEFKMFRYLDSNNGIEWWSSEELVIPYISPVDRKKHRYFPDIILKKKDDPQILVIEIKPEAQTKQPVLKQTKKGKPTKYYLKEVTEWGRNKAKWSAAEEFCKKKGWKFLIMTEKELGIKRNKK